MRGQNGKAILLLSISNGFALAQVRHVITPILRVLKESCEKRGLGLYIVGFWGGLEISTVSGYPPYKIVLYSK
jgi:hypothetical protein